MADEIQVVFKYQPDNTVCGITTTAEQSLADLRASWGLRTEKDPSLCSFRIHGAPDELPEEGVLGDILSPGAFSLAMEVRPRPSSSSQPLTVKILGSSSSSTCRIPCHSLTTPEDVIFAVRRRWGLRAHRPIRLIRGGAPLHPHVPLVRQGVPLDGEVAADLKVTVRVRTIAAPAFEPLESDDDEEEGGGGAEEDDFDFAAYAFSDDEADDDSDSDDDDYIEDDDCGDCDDEEEERRIDCFTSEAAECLLSERRPPTAQRLLCHGRVVRPQDAVLHCLGRADPLEVRELDAVLELQMVVAVVRAAGLDAAVETRRVWPSDRVRDLAPGARQAVFLEDVALDKSATFLDAHVANHMLLRVADTVPLTVRDGEGRRRVLQMDACASLADVYGRVRQFDPHDRLALWCDGRPLPDGPWPLGRSGVDERSEVEVRHVEPEGNACPPQRVEIGIQVSPTRKSCRSSNQTKNKMVPSSTATENVKKSSSTQSKETKAVASTQAPPPPTPPAEFFIRPRGDLRHLPNFHLRLPTTCGAVTVAQLRRAVEAEIRSKVLMRQPRATTPRGKEVFRITGDYDFDFVDSTGGKWKWSEVKEHRDVELSDTDPPLPAPAGVQLLIFVSSAK